MELHIFGDSSQDVLSAVVFLRGNLVTKGTDATELALVFRKARVLLVTCSTIPKLQVALLASRLRQEVQRAIPLNIERCFMWTNSTTVQQWLHSPKKQPVYAANRVTKSLEQTTDDEWNHIPRGDNPTDAGTRGWSGTDLFESS